MSDQTSQTLFQPIPSKFLAPKGEPENQEIKIVNTKEQTEARKGSITNVDAVGDGLKRKDT
jgi:hypothetical protein